MLLLLCRAFLVRAAVALAHLFAWPLPQPSVSPPFRLFELLRPKTIPEISETERTEKSKIHRLTKRACSAAIAFLLRFLLPFFLLPGFLGLLIFPSGNTKLQNFSVSGSNRERFAVNSR